MFAPATDAATPNTATARKNPAPADVVQRWNDRGDPENPSPALETEV